MSRDARTGQVMTPRPTIHPGMTHYLYRRRIATAAHDVGSRVGGCA